MNHLKNYNEAMDDVFDKINGSSKKINDTTDEINQSFDLLKIENEAILD